jgi:hypothetical protein
VQRWISKDSKPIRDAVQDWVKEQWAGLGLGGDSFIGRLRETVQQRLKKSPESLLQAPSEPLLQRATAQAAQAPKRGAPEVEASPQEVTAALAELERLLGTPEDDLPTDAPGELGAVLREAAGTAIAEWNQRVAELPVQLIEEPEFRFAGAEEAVRHVIFLVEQVLQHHEPLARDLTARALEAHARLKAVAGGTRRVLAVDVLEWLRLYPKWRYQSLMLGQVAGSFIGLRGHLSDTLREINSCRERLTGLLRQFDTPADVTPSSETGKRIYPDGCQTFDEALDRLLAGVTSEGMLDLDSQVEAMLRARFQALVHVCLTTDNIQRDVEIGLLTVAEKFAGRLLGPHDVAGLFLEQYPDEEQAKDEIAAHVKKAQPALRPDARGSRGVAQCVLTVPSGATGDHFRELADDVLPEGEINVLSNEEDIVIYRELSGLPLTEVEQLGPLGQDAYRQMRAAEHFTPHNRTDVPFAAPSR